MTLSHVDMDYPVTKVWFKDRHDVMHLVATLTGWQDRLLCPRDFGLTAAFWVSPIRHTVAVNNQGHVQHVHDHWDKVAPCTIDRLWQGRVHFVECQYDPPSPSLPSLSSSSTSQGPSSSSSVSAPSAQRSRAASNSKKNSGRQVRGRHGSSSRALLEFEAFNNNQRKSFGAQAVQEVLDKLSLDTKEDGLIFGIKNGKITTSTKEHPLLAEYLVKWLCKNAIDEGVSSAEPWDQVLVFFGRRNTVLPEVKGLKCCACLSLNPGKATRSI